MVDACENFQHYIKTTEVTYIICDLLNCTMKIEGRLAKASEETNSAKCEWCPWTKIQDAIIGLFCKSTSHARMIFLLGSRLYACRFLRPPSCLHVREAEGCLRARDMMYQNLKNESVSTTPYKTKSLRKWMGMWSSSSFPLQTDHRTSRVHSKPRISQYMTGEFF